MSTERPRMPSAGPEVRARRRFEERAVLVFAAVLIATALFGFLALLARDKSPTLFRWDVEAANTVHRNIVGHRVLVDLMRALSFIGSPVVWWVILGVTAGWLLMQRLYRLASFVAVTTIGSSLINHIVKVAVDRTRPHFDNPIVVAAGKSFPSGHAQSALVGYGVLLVVFVPVVARPARRWVIAAGVVLTLAIGLSRIALGAHFVSDVIGGYLAGVAWFLGMAYAFRAWRREVGKPAPPLAEGLEPEHREQLKP